MSVDCGSSRIGWWASFALSCPLIKLFPEAWWKRESSFRGDWASSTVGDLALCEGPALLCVSAGGEASTEGLTLANMKTACGDASVYPPPHLPPNLSAPHPVLLPLSIRDYEVCGVYILVSCTLSVKKKTLQLFRLKNIINNEGIKQEFLWGLSLLHSPVHVQMLIVCCFPQQFYLCIYI